MSYRPGRNAHGLTLIETLAAIFIFSIVTLGVIPVLSAALRGSELVRSSTVGKNIAVEAMERVRGLPYYISDARDASDVDILDLYYPEPPPSGSSYRTVCTSSASSAACPRGQIPAGYSIEYVATFENTNGDVVAPRPAYDSHPDGTGETDDPPSSLLNMKITARWTHFERDRSFVLETLVGDRKFGKESLRGGAILDYVVSVSTNYETVPDQTTLTVLGGTGESSLQSRTTTVAAQRVVSGSLGTAVTGVASTPVEGTSAFLEAPPDASETAPDADPPPLIVGGYSAADLEQAQMSGPSGLTRVHVGASPEFAEGGFLFPASTTVGNLWVDKAVDRSTADSDTASALRLLAGTKLVSVGPVIGGTVGPLRGFTSAVAESATTGGFTTRASGGFDRLSLLPTTFAPNGVIQIQNLTASVSCNSTSLGVPDPPNATWSGTLAFSYDRAEGGIAREPVTLTLSSSSSTDPLAVYRPQPNTASARGTVNPMIFEDVTNANQVGTGADRSSPGDVYLFPQSHVHGAGTADDHNHAGYIDSWQSRVGVSTRVGGNEDAASASIDEVVGLATTSLPAGASSTAPLFLSVGSMSCESLDQR